MRASLRLAALLTVLAGAVLVLSGSPVGSAHASCVGPEPAVGSTVPATPSSSPAVVDQVGAVTVSGEWFRHGCADTYTTHGCGAPTPDDPESPMLGVKLVLTQGASTWTLATSDAQPREQRYAITWSAPLPIEVEPGPATLSAAGVDLPIMITG